MLFLISSPRFPPLPSPPSFDPSHPAPFFSRVRGDEADEQTGSSPFTFIFQMTTIITGKDGG